MLADEGDHEIKITLLDALGADDTISLVVTLTKQVFVPVAEVI